MKKIFILLFLILFAMISWGDSPELVEKQFKLKAGDKGIVDIKDKDGEILISSHNLNEIHLRFEKQLLRRGKKRISKYFAKIYPEIRFSNNHLEVEIIWPKNQIIPFMNLPHPRIKVITHLMVPEKCDIKVRTTDGDVNVGQVSGTIHIRTTDGDIHLKKLSENITVQSADGDIKANDLSGDISMHTTDGDFYVHHYEGNLSIKTTDGDIEIKKGKGNLNTFSTDGDVSASGVFHKIKFRSGDGDGKFELLSGSELKSDCKFRSYDGDVLMVLPEPFEFSLKIRTRDGSIRLDKFPFTHLNRFKENKLDAQTESAKFNIDIQTGDGNITLKKK